MTRHRNRSRWGFVLPCFLLAGGWSNTGRAAPPVESPPAEEPPADGFEMDEGDSEGDFDDADVIEDVVVAAPEDGDTPPDEGPGEDDTEIDPGDGFVIEDISDDPEALEEEFKSADIDAKGKVGTVTGSVHNAKGEPLAGVEVRAGGTHYVAHTGVDGKFVLKLPPGLHTLSFTLDLYKSGELASVGVVEGQTSTQKIELVPLAGVEETVVVKDDLNMEAEGALQEKRKGSTKVTDGIDAAEIGKSGGGKVSSVAPYIVGATVVDGRYLFVRGLGHRYGNTFLDRARVPSPEPDLRTVPLDMFPSGALSAIDIQKTFSPDVPGDFAGGSTQLMTRDIPSETTISLGVAVGWNTNTTHQTRLSNGNFPGYDLLGLGNIPRARPSSYPEGQKIGRGVVDENLVPLYTAEEIEKQGEDLYTDYRVRRNSNAPVNYKLKATFGDSWATNRPGGRVGILFSGEYANIYQTNRGIRRRYGLSDGELLTSTPSADLAWERTSFRVAYSGLLGLRWNVDANNRLRATALYTRDAEDETAQIEGIDRTDAGADPILVNRIRYSTRAVAFTQLAGEHTIPRAANMKIEWFGSYSRARRDDPGMREVRFVNIADGGFNLDDSSGAPGSQLFLDFVDHTENIALDLTFPFKQWKGLEGKVKVGAWFEAKQREFTARRYYFSIASQLNDAIPDGTGNVINNSTIGGGVGANQGGTQPFTINEGTRASDNYAAWSRNLAGYAMLELPFVRWFKIVGGARVESNIIAVNPFDPYAAPDDPPDDTIVAARLVDLDVLPAASLIFSPKLPDKGGDFNIRVSGTKTIARPEFRELAPFLFRDYLLGFDKAGYADLKSSDIWNGDLRFEWFPRKKEVVALSGFFKYFDKPIEVITSPQYIYSWDNVHSAVNYGAEFEFRKALDFLVPKRNKQARRVLRDFSVGGNFSYVFSQATIRPCQAPPEDGEEPVPGLPIRVDCREAYQAATSRLRPLQGQAPWVANAYFDYDNGETGTNVRLLYNAVGPLIIAVGAQGLPDIYQQPVHNLDLIVGQRLLAFKRNEIGDLRNELVLSAEVGNLLNTKIESQQDGEIFGTTRDGLDFVLGLTWKY